MKMRGTCEMQGTAVDSARSNASAAADVLLGSSQSCGLLGGLLLLIGP